MIDVWPSDFLEQLLRHPNRDAPRLAYAAWLETLPSARAQQKAKWIRFQLANPEHRQRLNSGKELVLFRDETAYTVIGPVWLDWIEYHKGFVEAVGGRLREIINHPEMFSLHPIRQITITDYPQTVITIEDYETGERPWCLTMATNRTSLVPPPPCYTFCSENGIYGAILIHLIFLEAGGT